MFLLLGRKVWQDFIPLYSLTLRSSGTGFRRAASSQPLACNVRHVAMEVLFLLMLLALPFLLLLGVHIWRDRRGEKRNKRQLCYACGNSLFSNAGARAISHAKGGVYMYCASCERKHSRASSVGLIAMAVVLALFVGSLWLRSHA